MTKLTDEDAKTAFAPYLRPGERVNETAYGVKQPHIGLIILFTLLGVLPGVIYATVMTKHYLIGLTDTQFVVLQVKGMKSTKVKEVMVFPLADLPRMDVKTSENAIFTNIKLKEDDRLFVAKFHRAYSKVNRPNAQAIAGRLARS